MGRMKATIKAAAVDLFFRKGYFAASISEITRKSGIQKASLYYHYASKEDLLFQILEAIMDDLTGFLVDNIADYTNIEERMRAAVRGHVQFHLERQQETFVASAELRGLSAEHYREIVKKRDAYEAIFQELIREGQGQGVFAPGDVKILSYAILTLCTAGAAWYKPEGRLSVDRIAGIYENFVLTGLKAGGIGTGEI